MATLSAAASGASGTWRRRVAGQGALLLFGHALAQVLSFGRNAVLGYWLAKGDFGIAASITLALQLLETLTDIGADRALVQAEEIDAPRLMAAAHTMHIARGTLTAVVLYVAAGPIARFLDVAEAQAAFELAALVPLIRGLMHLEPRRRQRSLDNSAALAVEIVPQAAALVMVGPLLHLGLGYEAVVWLALGQAVIGVGLSHALARGRYAVGIDVPVLGHLFAFGWPIWLSAFPLIAVYQGDRLLVGRLFGMEALAGYSAAFLLTMVPGLLAAKTGNALLLPLLADARGEPEVFRQRYRELCVAGFGMACAYLSAFLVAGGPILRLAFGPGYAGYDAVIGWLALMWALRMVQAVPGMALMALGDTRPLLLAGLIRAAALVPALWAASAGLGLEGVAAAGCTGEVASLLYVAARIAHRSKGLAGASQLL